MDDAAECEAVFEGSAKVLDVDIVVGLCRPLAPQEQALLPIFGDNETKNDLPDEAKNDARVAIDEVIGADIDKVELLLFAVINDAIAVFSLWIFIFGFLLYCGHFLYAQKKTKEGSRQSAAILEP